MPYSSTVEQLLKSIAIKKRLDGETNAQRQRDRIDHAMTHFKDALRRELGDIVCDGIPMTYTFNRAADRCEATLEAPNGLNIIHLWYKPGVLHGDQWGIEMPDVLQNSHVPHGELLSWLVNDLAGWYVDENEPVDW